MGILMLFALAVGILPAIIFILIVVLKIFYPQLNILTGLSDLQKFRYLIRNTKGKKQYKHAIVCGGSIAGLLATRVLLDHFEQVTLIERDDLLALAQNDEPQMRPNVPQQYYTHAIHTTFTKIIETLFPGIIERFEAKGAKDIDMGRFKWYFYGGWLATQDTGACLFFASRPLMEHGIRKSLFNEYGSRITTLCGFVEGFIKETEDPQLDGVNVCLKNGEKMEVHGDFVVDATGRNRKGVKWLQEIGYEEPPYEEYDAFVSYAAKMYRPKGKKNLDTPLVIYTDPSEAGKNGYCTPIEGNRIITTLMGLSKEVPSTVNFEEWANTLPCDDIYEMLKHMEPISEVYSLKSGKNKMLQYHKIKTPTNFVAVGDALCTFNPVYGQGLTTAAAAAVALDTILRDSSNCQISSKYFQKMHWRLFLPWNLPKALDMRYEHTTPKDNSLLTTVLKKILPFVYGAAYQSKRVHVPFMRLLGMSGSPLELINIKILWDIIKYSATK